MSDDYRRMFAFAGGPTTTYPVSFGDRKPKVDYAFSPAIELAVNVALATGRPLLVLGPAGSGKTSLGIAVAARLEWDLYQTVVTSRTRAQDLLWTFDNVRRLSAAMAAAATSAGVDDEAFVEPGPLWWALQPKRAASLVRESKVDSAIPVFSKGSVVVIDEIDKADPAVPNDLLRPLGDLAFEVTDLAGEAVTLLRPRPPLVFITSNGERTLPPAFVRRCVVLELPGFDPDWLLKVAALHFPRTAATTRKTVLEHLVGAAPVGADGKPAIGTAEYLDVLRACRELKVKPGDDRWPLVSAIALLKPSARTD